MTIIKTLNELAYECRSNFEYINAGGCCIYATFVSQCLTLLSVEHEIITLGKREASTEEARVNCRGSRELRDWTDNGICFHHILIRIEGKMYDSNGWDMDEKYEHMNVHGSITTDEAYAFGIMQNDWNWCFDRSEIPEMQKTIFNKLLRGQYA